MLVDDTNYNSVRLYDLPEYRELKPNPGYDNPAEQFDGSLDSFLPSRLLMGNLLHRNKYTRGSPCIQAFLPDERNGKKWVRFVKGVPSMTVDPLHSYDMQNIHPLPCPRRDNQDKYLSRVKGEESEKPILLHFRDIDHTPVPDPPGGADVEK